MVYYGEGEYGTPIPCLRSIFQNKKFIAFRVWNAKPFERVRSNGWTKKKEKKIKMWIESMCVELFEARIIWLEPI